MRAATRGKRLLIAPLLVVAALAAAPSASAALPASLLSACAPKDALDDNTANNGGVRELPFTFCDDGVPAFGGTTPNVTGANAVMVPGAYGGQAAGLPAKSGTVPGADPGGDIALDVDLSLPDPTRNPMPVDGYPLIVLMHGCCSGSKTSWEGATIDPGGKENWHYNSAWFASRGYVVLTYTSRGFVDGNGHGSTGEAQLDSNRFEINDYQHLAGQLADTADLDPTSLGNQKIDPSMVVPTGGSYGGGFTWLALTDPVWKSPGNTDMKVVAAAPKFGWTNLVESLVPNGADLRDKLPTTDPVQARSPVGFPKHSINAALYASGKTGVPPGSPHTTFPSDIDQAQACLSSSDPFEQNPLCTTTFSTTLARFIDERSAYFQNGFFTGLKNGTVDPVPVFAAGTFTDNLFPAAEHRRMVERLKAVALQRTPPVAYPVQEYYGDYNHFVQDKRKEWADLCGADHHVCAYTDYPAGSPQRDLNATPAGLSRELGVTTRLNRFIDHYAKPPGNSAQGQPAFDVTGALQVCPQNAAFVGAKEDEPGPRFTAGTFAGLAPNTLTVTVNGSQPTTNVAGANPHAKNDDPVGNLATHGGSCPVESSPGGLASAGPGVATYDSDPLASDFTMVGITRTVVQHTGAGAGLQLNARLYDLYPNGDQVLVDRGVKRLPSAMGPTTLDLHGAGWRFARGHRVRVELAQDDDPYIKSSVQPGSLVIAGVKLQVPIREGSLSIGGRGGPTAAATVSAPRLASDQGTRSRFRIRVRRSKATPAVVVDHYEVEARDTRSKTARRLTSSLRGSLVRFKGRGGRTYRFRARAVDRTGLPGDWSEATTVVPLEDGRKATPSLRYRGRWSRPRSRRAYGARLSRTSRRGAAISLRFRGDRLYLVGRRTRFGGKAQVILNGRKRTVSFYARRTRNRQVIAVLRGKRTGLNRLKVVALGRRGARRARGRRVEIDALGVRRP